jgi:PmbA protein
MSEPFLSSAQEITFYTPKELPEFEENLEAISKKAKALGADAVEAVLMHGTSFSLDYRLGKIENVELSESTRWGVRLFLGKRQASVSSNDFSKDVCERLLQEALMVARLTPEDPYCGLAEPDVMASNDPSGLDLESYDSTVPSPAALQELVLACEQAALEVPGVVSSEGASISWGKSTLLLKTSKGFSGISKDSSFSLWASVLAEKEGDKQREAYGHAAVFLEDLEPPRLIGQTAGDKAVRSLNPRKFETGQVPVVYDALISRTLLGHLLGAIKGTEIARKTSFLQEALGTHLFPSDVTIVDDPLRKRGFGSRTFDGEGLPVRPLKVVEEGVLTSWLLNLHAARQLKLAPTGHASLALGSAPGISCSNFYMLPGKESLQSLLSSVQRGFYVTGLMGMGVNSLTGDYSMGANGFLIEKGQLTVPVHEVTIAGTLLEMFRGMTPADDLVFRGAVSAPTLRIHQMMVAGAG